MLDAHPQLAVVNETYWVSRKFRERNGLTREGTVTPALVGLLLASPRFSHMGVTEGDLRDLLSESDTLPYALFVARIFDMYAARRGKALAGDKTPGYVRRIPQIHDVWPRAKFVHIIRDPRDVCLSMLDWSGGEQTAGQDGTWAIDPVVSIALYWRYSVTVGRAAATTLGPSLYREVRYEDLVASATTTLERTSDFLRLQYAPAMARFHERGTGPHAELSAEIDRRSLRSASNRWLRPTAGLRDWRTQLPPGDAERIEVAAGDVMIDLGYATSASRASSAVRDHVARVHEIYTNRLLARGRPLPANW
jgi:hypothetical protein